MVVEAACLLGCKDAAGTVVRIAGDKRFHDGAVLGGVAFEAANLVQGAKSIDRPRSMKEGYRDGGSQERQIDDPRGRGFERDDGERRREDGDLGWDKDEAALLDPCDMLVGDLLRVQVLVRRSLP